MTIIRAARKTHYAVISNSVLDDKRLTWGARGMLAHLLSKPDNWRVIVEALINETSKSRVPSARDSVRAMLKELMDAGYIVRTVRREEGVFSGYDYIVSDLPGTDQPAPDQPAPAQTPLVSTEKAVSTEQGEKPLIDKSIDAAFERFWQAGMRKIGKKAALKAYRHALLAWQGPVDDFVSTLCADVSKRVGKQMGFDQMHPATYLNGERWKDELPSARESPRQTIQDARAHTIAVLTGRTGGQHESDDPFTIEG